MADQNITELPVKTSSGITSSDYMLGIDSAEGYQMLIRDLGDYIIRNVQVNTIAGANQTLKAALDTLNSNVDRDETLTLTKNTDYIGMFSNSSYRLSGHLALINGYFQFAQSNIPASTVLFTLPSGLEFKCRQYIAVINKDYSFDLNFEVHENTGNIRPSATLANINPNQYYYFSFIANIK